MVTAMRMQPYQGRFPALREAIPVRRRVIRGLFRALRPVIQELLVFREWLGGREGRRPESRRRLRKRRLLSLLGTTIDRRSTTCLLTY